VRALAPRRLAEDSGLGQTAVRDIVEGRSRAPKPSTLAALARTLGVPVEELGARAREPGAAGRRVARPAAPSKRARHRDATRAPDEVVLVALADGSEVEVRCRRSMDAADWEAVRALAEVRRAAADGGREAGRRSAPAP